MEAQEHGLARFVPVTLLDFALLDFALLDFAI
jgi:hypothetical protein